MESSRYNNMNSQTEINNTVMLHKSILGIRHELIDFISECAVDQRSLINKVSNLPDYKILELYIKYTFDGEWRGIFIDEL